MSQWSEKIPKENLSKTVSPTRYLFTSFSETWIQINNFRKSSKKFIIDLLTKNVALNFSGALFFVGLGYSLKWWYKDQLFVVLLKQNLPVLSESQQNISWKTGESVLNDEYQTWTPLIDCIDLDANHIRIKFKQPWQRYAYEQFVGVFGEPAQVNVSKQVLITKEKDWWKENISVINSYLPNELKKNTVVAKQNFANRTPFYLSPFPYLDSKGLGTSKETESKKIEEINNYAGSLYSPKRVLNDVVNKFLTYTLYTPEKPIFPKKLFKLSPRNLYFLNQKVILPPLIKLGTKQKSSFSKVWVPPAMVKGFSPIIARVNPLNGYSAFNNYSPSFHLDDGIHFSGASRFFRNLPAKVYPGWGSGRSKAAEQRYISTDKLSYSLPLTKKLAGWQPFPNLLVLNSYLDEIPYKLENTLQSYFPKKNSQLLFLSTSFRKSINSTAINDVVIKNSCDSRKSNVVIKTNSVNTLLCKASASDPSILQVLTQKAFTHYLPLQSLLYKSDKSKSLFQIEDLVANSLQPSTASDSPLKCTQYPVGLAKQRGTGVAKRRALTKMYLTELAKQGVHFSREGLLPYKFILANTLLGGQDQNSQKLAKEYFQEILQQQEDLPQHEKLVIEELEAEGTGVKTQKSLLYKSKNSWVSDSSANYKTSETKNNEIEKTLDLFKETFLVPTKQSETYLKKLHIFETKKLLQNQFASLINSFPIDLVEKSKAVVEKGKYSHAGDDVSNVVSKTIIENNKYTPLKDSNLSIPLDNKSNLFETNGRLLDVTKQVLAVKRNTQRGVILLSPEKAQHLPQCVQSKEEAQHFATLRESLAGECWGTEVDRLTQLFAYSTVANAADVEGLDPLLLLNTLGFTFNNFSPLTSPPILASYDKLGLVSNGVTNMDSNSALPKESKAVRRIPYPEGVQGYGVRGLQFVRAAYPYKRSVRGSISVEQLLCMPSNAALGQVQLCENLYRSISFYFNRKNLNWVVFQHSTDDKFKLLVKKITSERNKEITSTVINNVNKISFKQKETKLETLNKINVVDKDINFDKNSRYMSGYVYPDIQSNSLKAFLYQWLGKNKNLMPSHYLNNNSIAPIASPLRPDALPKPMSANSFQPSKPQGAFTPTESEVELLASYARPTTLQALEGVLYKSKICNSWESKEKKSLLRTAITNQRFVQQAQRVPFSGTTTNQFLENNDNMGHIEIPYKKFNHYLAKFPGFSDPNQFFTTLPQIASGNENLVNESSILGEAQQAYPVGHLLQGSQKQRGSKIETEKKTEKLSFVREKVSRSNDSSNIVDKSEINKKFIQKNGCNSRKVAYSGIVVRRNNETKDFQPFKDFTSLPAFTPQLSSPRCFANPTGSNALLLQIEDLYSQPSHAYPSTEMNPYSEGVQGYGFISVEPFSGPVQFSGELQAEGYSFAKKCKERKAGTSKSSIWGTLFLGPENPLTNRQCHFFGQKQLSTLDTNSLQRDYLRQLGNEILKQSNSKGYTELSKFSSIERTKILSLSKKVNSFFFKKRKYSYLLEPKDQWHLLFQEQLCSALEDCKKYPLSTIHSFEETNMEKLKLGSGRIKVSAPLVMARFPKKLVQSLVQSRSPLVKSSPNGFDSLPHTPLPLQGMGSFQWRGIGVKSSASVHEKLVSHRLEQSISWRPFCHLQRSFIYTPLKDFSPAITGVNPSAVQIHFSRARVIPLQVNPFNDYSPTRGEALRSKIEGSAARELVQQASQRFLHYPLFTERFSEEINAVPCLNKNSCDSRRGQGSSTKMNTVIKDKGGAIVIKNNNLLGIQNMCTSLLIQEPLNCNSWAVLNQWVFLIALLFWVEQTLLNNVFPALFALEQILLSAAGLRTGENNRTHVLRISKKETPKFQNLAGIDGLLGELSELVLFLRGQRNLGIAKLSFWNKWNKKNSYGVLLTGSPGTGKTFLVRALANEAKVPVLILSASTLTASKLNNNKPSWSIRRAFKRAKQLAPCILFIDEIDALGKSRGKIVTDINEIVADTNLTSASFFTHKKMLTKSTHHNSVNSQQMFSYEQFGQNSSNFNATLLNKWEYPLQSTILQESNEINQNSLCQEKLVDLLQIAGAEGKFRKNLATAGGITEGTPLGKESVAEFKESTSSDNIDKGLAKQQLTREKEITRGKFGPLTQLLVSMDGVSSFSGVLIMGATNRPELLDPALTRPGRFEKTIRIDKPSEQNRIEILQLYSQNLGVQQQIPWSYLATRTIGLTTADLAVAMNYSSLKAIIQDSVHTLETIEYGLNCITRL